MSPGSKRVHTPFNILLTSPGLLLPHSSGLAEGVNSDNRRRDVTIVPATHDCCASGLCSGAAPPAYKFSGPLGAPLARPWSEAAVSRLAITLGTKGLKLKVGSACLHKDISSETPSWANAVHGITV